TGDESAGGKGVVAVNADVVTGTSRRDAKSEPHQRAQEQRQSLRLSLLDAVRGWPRESLHVRSSRRSASAAAISASPAVVSIQSACAADWRDVRGGGHVRLAHLCRAVSPPARDDEADRKPGG